MKSRRSWRGILYHLSSAKDLVLNNIYTVVPLLCTELCLYLLFYTDLWFVVKWLEDEDDVCDSLPAKDVVDNVPVYNTEVGRKCKAHYLRKLYPIEVLAKGV